MNKLSLDILHVRRPPISYVTPAICETIFSSSSFPVLVLDALSVDANGNLVDANGNIILAGVGGFPGGGGGNIIDPVSGMRMIWFGPGGGGPVLAWDTYPGAICYTIYRVNDVTDPFGAYHIIADCVTDPQINLPLGDPDYNPDPDAINCYLVQAVLPSGFVSAAYPQCVKNCDLPFNQCHPPFIPPSGGGLPGAGLAVCPGITSESVLPVVSFSAPDSATLGPVTVDEGSSTVSYKWFKDGVFNADTTTTTKNSLVISITVPTDAGVYRLHVISSVLGCEAWSGEIILTECPSIQAEGITPVSGSAGGSATLGPVTISAGAGPVIYEWWKNGVFYADTTATTQNSLMINPIGPTDDGVYVLKVINSTLNCTAISAEIVFDVTGDFAWADLVWADPPTLIPGSGTISGTWAGDSWTVAVTNIPVMGFSPATGDDTAVGIYTGPLKACKVTIVATVWNLPNPGITNFPIVISQDGVPVLNINLRNDIPGVGTFEFPFNLQAGTGTVITVDNAAGQIYNGVPAQQATYSGTISFV